MTPRFALALSNLFIYFLNWIFFDEATLPRPAAKSRPLHAHVMPPRFALALLNLQYEIGIW
jgi:hypothetical protein